jgi:transposase-like protein
MPMVYVPVQCPHCQSTEVIKAGTQATGAQRYRCPNRQCKRRIFLLQYQDRGRAPEICRQGVDLALTGSGIRDSARVLRMSPTTVIARVKKSRRAATRQPRVGDTPSCKRRRRARPTKARSRNRCNGEFYRGHSDRAAAVACERSAHGESARVRRWPPEGCDIPEAPRFAGSCGHYALLYRHGGRLSAAASARAAHRREVVDAKERAKAPSIAHSSQAPRPYDALCLPLAPPARPEPRVIDESRGIRPCSVKRTRYQSGTLPMLRKRLFKALPRLPTPQPGGIDRAATATVPVTCEDPGHPHVLA